MLAGVSPAEPPLAAITRDPKISTFDDPLASAGFVSCEDTGRVCYDLRLDGRVNSSIFCFHNILTIGCNDQLPGGVNQQQCYRFDPRSRVPMNRRSAIHALGTLAF